MAILGRRILLALVLIALGLGPSSLMAEPAYFDPVLQSPYTQQSLDIPSWGEVSEDRRVDLADDDKCSAGCCATAMSGCCGVGLPADWSGTVTVPGLSAGCFGTPSLPENVSPEAADKPPRALGYALPGHTPG
jgi:hypothetical protein